ncbi:hypothetical protein B0T21DRAFT_125853 [Apiosordaria backusii]|uniref:F-box domain-containing protein n=1 Tax=Apiosordaria backusii TaxID=314023 RepID=A0AA40EMU1_9PEZI|nr:hypothetical protein B0T21DRAFT_125853 [Apiosordaria backusii]
MTSPDETATQHPAGASCSLSPTPTTTTPTADEMVGILQLPPEIFHNILAYLDVRDFGTLPQVCKAFKEFVTGNNPLCRDIYLRILDKPVSTTGIDFVQELHDLLRLEQVITAYWLVPEDEVFFEPNPPAKEELPFVHRTITRLLKSIPPLEHGPEELSTRLVNAETYHRSATVEYLSGIISEAPESSGNEHWNGAVECYFNQSTIFKRIVKHPRRHYPHISPKTVVRPLEEVTEEEKELRQMSAHLHCLLGISDLLYDVTSGNSLKRWSLPERAYATACSKVYDIREYRREETAWGPFYTPKSGEGEEKPGLRVDWEKAEAVMIVLGVNLRAKGLAFFDAVDHVWGKRFGGCWEGSYIPWVPESVLANLEKKRLEEEEDEDEEEREKRLELEELKKRDPYGVCGTWLRVVCFLDYTDFFHFNFHNDGDRLPAEVPRPPLSTGEAVRLILMKVHVTKIEPADADAGEDENWPVVYFEGQSRALDWSWDGNADSELKGTVRMTKDGEVRWTTYSIYDGEERWKSEGFQLGGRKSARGIIGNWFDKDYNEHGPCGPTAFWKVSDHEYDSNSDDTGDMLNNLLPLRTPFFSPMELSVILTVVVDNDDDDSDDPDAADNEADSDEDGSISDEFDEEEEEEEEEEDEDEDLDHELEQEEDEDVDEEEEEIEVFGGGLTFAEDLRPVPGSALPPPWTNWEDPVHEAGGEEEGDAEKENQDQGHGEEEDNHENNSEAVGREDADIQPPTGEELPYDSGQPPYEDGLYNDVDGYMEEMRQLPSYEISGDSGRFNDMMASRYQIGMAEPELEDESGEV